MASHLLDEVEKVCTHVAILKQGDLKASGNVNEMFVHEDIVELAAADMDQLDAILNANKQFTKKNREQAVIQLFYPQGQVKLDDLNAYCFANGITLNHLQMKKKSLESKFFELTN